MIIDVFLLSKSISLLRMIALRGALVWEAKLVLLAKDLMIRMVPSQYEQYTTI